MKPHKVVVLVILSLLIFILLCACQRKPASGSIVQVAPTPDPAATISSPPSLSAPVTPSPSPSASSTTSISTSKNVAFINADEVNVRSGTSTESSIIGTLSLCTQVVVVQKDAGKGWTEIQYNGQTAYVALKYVTMLNAPSENKNGTINADSVNLRAGATTSSKSMGRLEKDTKVSIVKADAGHGWTLIAYEGKIVYVAKQYVSMEG